MGRWNPMNAHGSSLPLVGRAAELARIDAALHAASEGRGRVVVLAGEAGIGKTRLLEEALTHAAALDFRCYLGGADELERRSAFGAISTWFRPSRTRPGTGSGHEPGGEAGDTARTAGSALLGAPEEEFRIIDALVERIEALCHRGPVALALEDLQWADPSSMLAVNRLARELATLPAALLLTLRPVPRRPELQSLLDGLVARGCAWVAMGRMDGEAIEALVGMTLGAPPGQRLRAHLARAGGNPLFATELVASLEREGAISVGDVAETEAVDLPASLPSAILHRLSFLSDSSREILQVASILGSHFAVEDLAACLGQQVPALKPVLAEAVRAGILDDGAAFLSFHHDLIREALYQTMPGALRSWWHVAAARVLAESGRSHDEVAEHIVRGAVPGDLHAAEWLRTAASLAASRSPKVAVELLRHAVDLAPPSEPHREAALADLAQYTLRAGQLPEADELCRHLLAGALDPAIRQKVLVCHVEVAIGQGRIEESLATLNEAVASAGCTDGERARLWAWSSTSRAVLWDLPGATHAAGRALELADATGDHAAAGVALGSLAAIRHLQGDYPAALDLARSSLRRVGEAGGPGQPFLPVLTLVSLLIDTDRVEVARETLEARHRLRREEGAGWDHPVEHFLSGLGHFWTGTWGEASRAVNRGLNIAETIFVRRGTAFGHAVLALIALHRGELGSARREAALAEAEADATGPQWRPNWVQWARALLAEAEGRQDHALTLLRKAWETCDAAGVVGELPAISPDLVRLALATGESLLAERVTEAMEALACRSGIPSVAGAAARCRALVSRRPEDLLAAVEAYRASPRRRELGLACESAAPALVGTGRVAEACSLAEEACAIFASIGAVRDLSRAQERFRAAGILVTPGDASFATGGAAGEVDVAEGGADAVDRWSCLTPAEREVTRLVAKGLSNREIACTLTVSPRTVQTHVSHVLDKLDLASRVELAVKANSPAPPHENRGGQTLRRA